MKSLVFTLFFVTLGFTQLQGQYILGLEKKDGVYFKGDTDVAFSGEAYSFFADGNIRIKYHLVDGKFDGTQIYFNENGKRIKETNFNKGTEEGIYKEYFPNGKRLMVEGLYYNDYRYGTWTYFNDRGDKIKEERYAENGERAQMLTF